MYLVYVCVKISLLSKSLYQNRCYFDDHNCGFPNLAKPGHHSITSNKCYLCKCLNVAICGHQSNLRECPNPGYNLPAMVSFKLQLKTGRSNLVNSGHHSKTCQQWYLLDLLEFTTDVYSILQPTKDMLMFYFHMKDFKERNGFSSFLEILPHIL